MLKENILPVLKNKKYQIIATSIIFIIILLLSSSIRLSNWDLLTDSTTGKKIPLALDPYYFLRVAETIVENNGKLPLVDTMRYNAAWHPEILPRVIVIMWKSANIFGDYSLREVDVFSPVVFYFIGLILFFFLCYFLTNSKAASLISSGLLAFSTLYLYRTMAGFSDHEAIGMMALFGCLLFYIFALKNFEKDWKRTILYGLGIGFFTSLVLASWSGASTFVLMVIPISFLAYWLLKNKDKVKAIAFFVIWIISSILIPWIFNKDLMGWMIRRFSATYGLLAQAVLLFIVVDFIIEWLVEKNKLKINKDKKILLSLGSSAILGGIGLTIIGKNIFSIIKSVWYSILFPFGRGRVDMTVAENTQPYLINWIGQSGTIIFWLFVLGIFLIGIEFGKSIKSKKHFIWFSLLWITMISSMLFSRISASSIFNGENFISQIIYLLGVGVFVVYFIWLIMHKMFDNENINLISIILMALMFVVILNGRSAIRTFFLITPFVLLSVGYFVIKIYEYAISNKEEVFSYIFWALFIIALSGVLFSANIYRENTTNQAKYIGPAADLQWQNAMSWVRENTEKESKFAHWWDYGYWIQTLGERPTIADGGHFQGNYNGNERIGRYLLTTDKPASAYSLMKTHNISYLLIDPTDFGKYSAYSKIGSDDNWDRFSTILISVSNEKDVTETSDGITRIYQFNSIVDEDIYYEEIFLPGPTYDKYGTPSYKSFISGIILNINNNGTINQPIVVYVYNNIQYRIPLRYIYVDSKWYDFGIGIEGVLKLIPAIQESNQGISINQIGAGIYLSPKTGKTLFSKLYLMNDPLGEYKDISLAHSEDDPIVKNLKMQGAAIKDFVYYRGFRGPIKIWNVNYPTETPIYEEFLNLQTGYADMDWRFE